MKTMLVSTFASLFLLLGIGAAVAQQRPLGDAEVQTALDAGRDDDLRDDLFAACEAKPGFRERAGRSFTAGLTGSRTTYSGPSRGLQPARPLLPTGASITNQRSHKLKRTTRVVTLTP